jgi:excisionase family DNA binding protein
MEVMVIGPNRAGNEQIMTTDETSRRRQPTESPVQSEAPRLYTVAEVAQTLRIGRSTAYELIQTGRLSSVTIGRSRRVPARAVDDYVERLEGGLVS